MPSLMHMHVVFSIICKVIDEFMHMAVLHCITF